MGIGIGMGMGISQRNMQRKSVQCTRSYVVRGQSIKNLLSQATVFTMELVRCTEVYTVHTACRVPLPLLLKKKKKGATIDGR